MKLKDACSSHEIKRHLLLGRKVMTNLLLLLSHSSRVWLCVTPQTAVHQAALSLGFSRQEHWSGLPFPSPVHESESEVTQLCPTRQHINKQKHYFANKGPSSQSYGFSSSHVWMWELDYKESWVPKNWCFWTVVLEKALESSLNCKEIQPVHPKGNQSWIFIAEAKTPILWPPDVKNWLIWKDSDSGKDWRQETKGTTEDEMVGWHQLTQWTCVWVNSWVSVNSGVGDSKGGLACCSPWGRRVGHDWVTELNWYKREQLK